MRTRAGPSTATKSELDARLGSMRQLAFSGIRWGSLAGIVEQVAAVATTVVLVRLLTPADFGIVTAATVAVGLFEVLTRLGFGAALVNRKTVDERAASSTFWLALATGLVVSASVAAASPLLADAVGKPDVAPYIAVASIIIAVGQTSRVTTSLMLRDLRFKAAYMADIASMLAYSGTAITLAAATNLGPWAIIVGRVVGGVVGTIARLVAGRWYPKPIFDIASVREDLRFNLGFITNHLMSFGAKNADYWVLGQTTTSAALGSYYVAFVLPNILRQRMTWLTSEVLFPVLSRVRDQPERISEAYAQVVRTLAFVAFPALLGISLLSEPIVLVFFGSNWLAAAAPLSIIAVAAAVETVTQVATTVLLSQGKPGRSAIVNGVRLLALAAALTIAVQAGGLVSVAWAVLASTVVAAAAAQRMLNLTISAVPATLLRTCWPILFPTAVMLAVVAVTMRILPAAGHPLLVLSLSAVVGAVSYLASGLLLFRKEFKHLAKQVRELLQPSGRQLGNGRRAVASRY
jgi:O-antigen/teichoic acid export membrane protein